MPRAVVLLSGGMDSATTLALAVRDGFESHALTLRYGQKNALELERAALIARLLGAASHRFADADLAVQGASALTDVSIPVPKSLSDEVPGSGIPPTYVPARNIVLLSMALSYAEVLRALDVFVGINAVDFGGYPDCRPAFLEAFEKVANLGTRAGVLGDRFRLRAPLMEMSKADIVRTAVALGVDLAATLSCYDPEPGGHPCGACDSCRIRARGFREAGIPDPALERRMAQGAKGSLPRGRRTR